MICKSTANTSFFGTSAPFTVARIVDMPTTMRGDLLVSWWIPDQTPKRDFKVGRKRKVVDLFATWRPMAALTPSELTGCLLPETFVSQDAVLHAAFSMEGEGLIPFSVFDALRADHDIDVTSLTLSQTQRGNVYRNYVLMGAC